MIVEQTIWKRLMHIPASMRSVLRREMAQYLDIEPRSVLSHMQKHGFWEMKARYRHALCILTKTELGDWGKSTNLLFFDFNLGKYSLRELTPEEEQALAGAGEGQK